MNLAYQLWRSSPTAPRIVLLHGMGGTGALWRPIAVGLEDRMQVLAPDQRGHGKSQIEHIPGSRHEPGYTPLDYGRDLIETLDDLGYHPTWIVGHSMGVRTAVAAAHLHPEMVQGLVLIDLGFSGVAGGGLGEGLAKFIEILPNQFESREAARAFMSANCPDPSIAQYLMAVATSPGGTSGAGKSTLSFPFDHAALVKTIHAARNVSVRGWVSELKMPIYILRGEKSKVWSHAEFEAEKLHFAQLGQSSIEFLEFANAGHGLPFEQRAKFVEWLKSVCLPKT